MKTKYKTWCKGCNDFTIHSIIQNSVTSSEYKSNDDYICDKCGLKHTDIEFIKIPNNKLEDYIDEYLYVYESDNHSILINTGIDEPYNLIYNSYNLDFYIGAADMFLENLPYQLISEEKIGRNDLCPCGSGKKYKKCCLNK